MEDLSKLLKIVIDNQERLIELLKEAQPERVEPVGQMSVEREIEIFMRESGRDR